jgi:hypothetical protein
VNRRLSAESVAHFCNSEDDRGVKCEFLRRPYDALRPLLVLVLECERNDSGELNAAIPRDNLTGNRR